MCSLSKCLLRGWYVMYLECHNQLDSVQAIEAKILLKAGSSCNLAGINTVEFLHNVEDSFGYLVLVKERTAEVAVAVHECRGAHLGDSRLGGGHPGHRTQATS